MKWLNMADTSKTTTMITPLVSSTANELTAFRIPESEIFDHWKSILESQTYGDAIIEADGKEFLVYRGILEIRSPVFAAMFKGPFEEQKTNRVVMKDANHEVVQEMLTYIYTDRAPKLKHMAPDLLVMAEKYDLERLKIMCEEALCAELIKENAIEVLILANTHNAASLKTHVINFMAANSSYFLEKSTWKSSIARLVKADFPNLLAEVTRVMATLHHEYYARSKATFTFKVENFSRMENQVLSPPCIIRNLPWKIMIRRTTGTKKVYHGQKCLGFFFQCNAESDSSLWSCYASAEFVILSQKKGVDNKVRKASHIFYPKENNWGYNEFILWDDVMNPEEGFIKNDTVIFEARVDTDPPEDVRTRFTGALQPLI